ncbi:hypothetical protein F2P81_012041 [Scophthalmus maximus]|uniref:Uncharacterized protein n=1 Tax=Scophthalmus maximus TaxID=52904 RepID=A0A6A4SVN2_SCOMX|nr:hypothetical protein F2P81_012041 [Scophthalmus maximus]
MCNSANCSNGTEKVAGWIRIEAEHEERRLNKCRNEFPVELGCQYIIDLYNNALFTQNSCSEHNRVGIFSFHTMMHPPPPLPVFAPFTQNSEA